jgi:hypothetical protein
VRLVLDERESGALRTFLTDSDLVSCELVLTEIPRAIRRAPGHDRRFLGVLLDRAGEVLDAVALLPLTVAFSLLLALSTSRPCERSTRSTSPRRSRSHRSTLRGI